MDEAQMDISVGSTPADVDRPMSDVEETTPLAVNEYDAIANKIMPDLGQEIEDFKYYTWQVNSWRNLEKRITGPEFEAGGWKWWAIFNYILFGAPQGWHACVQFALVLWNPEDPTHYIHHHAHHRFTAEESDWGFTRFYDYRKLFNPLENRTRALIENDTTHITAFVRVLKDPTEDDEPCRSVSLALQRVFYQLQTSNTPVGTTELTKSFGWDSEEAFRQHDVQELNRVLQDNLEGKMKMKSYIKCVNVDYESSRVEDYYDIQLNVKGCKTLQDSFKDYIQEETLEGDNKYQAEGYGLQEAKKGVIFDSFPPVLHLQLKRFEYDVQRDAMVKINDRHDFPMEIELSEFLSPEADKSRSHRYLLHGVLVHSGDLHGGHYFALLKPEKDGKWFKFDDDRVTRVTDKEVLEDNYGGEGPNSSPLPIRPGTRNLKRFTNAYMLVYIRESEVDEILAPVSPENVPEHLERRLKEEKALHDQKKKEAEERHLYLQVKVVTAETFRNYQGFDLANFDDRQYPLSPVPQYKVLKNDTYGSFKESVARDIQVPAEQIRFWVLVNRQNKTVRPDAPISDNHINSTMEEIHTKMASRQNELKLYLEVADKSNNPKKLFPPHEGNAQIMIFLKYFDPDTQSLEGLNHLYIQKFGKVGDIIPILCEKKELPQNTPLKLYEEIKPSMIEEMKPKSTFQQSEIQDGDIICFQKVLTEREIQEHSAAGRVDSIPQFYEFLSMRIVVQFKPKPKPKEGENVSKFKDLEPKPEFELVLNKKMNYDAAASQVAAHLNTDPLKLRFTTAHSGTPKNVIKRTTTQTLAEMLQPSYLAPSAYLLFYEMLDISIVELETKKFFKIYWLGTNVKEEKEIIDVRLQKTALVNEIIEAILQKVTLSIPNNKIRLYEVMNHKIQKEYTGTESIDRIHEFVTLYAEEIPEEELKAEPNDKIIQVYHFTKESLRTHGIPFKFVIKAVIRLQQRLGMNEKDFAKVRVAVVQGATYPKHQYLEDDVILSEIKWGNDDYLGLDHVDKTGRAGRSGGAEKAIFIRG
ncbi:2181_t:CDS:10 [Diversispora eburnea]|uniref:ubiquitinyl hydrolase 1 n=1 Tax=Diversispora eburnea TaxID=1213867 RepID=A0A9N9A3Y4_9GLOM|nr:2181_t:CDS:10 [Diversispora eburnea]